MQGLLDEADWALCGIFISDFVYSPRQLILKTIIIIVVDWKRGNAYLQIEKRFLIDDFE